MSVSLNPSNSLGFRRPLTQLVKRSLTITNNNPQPVAFKVKTTAPKLYCVRPNSGRVEPGESIDVSVMLQALKEEPPLNMKCKDKFLIQSTIITPEKETMSLADIWSSPDINEEGKVFQQKLRVTYLPAEGQVLEEEEENPAGIQAEHHDPGHESTIRQPPANGHGNIQSHYVPAPAPDHHEDRAHTPVQFLERDASYESENQPAQQPIPVIVEPSAQQHPSQSTPAAPLDEPAPEPEPQAAYESFTVEPPVSPAAAPPVPLPESAPAPEPTPVAVSAPTPEPIIIHKENPVNEELYAKYRMALEENEKLKAQIAELTSPATQELRRRTRKLSDADSSNGSDAQIALEDPRLQQEGVPLQVVVIIALGVFVTTYLFF